jgi:hypothetical protein
VQIPRCRWFDSGWRRQSDPTNCSRRQSGLVGFLSLGWFGLLPGLQGADNPLWFYLAAVLQFPASLLFTAILGPIAKVFTDDVQRLEVAGAVVAVVEFVLLAIVIKKIRDFWRS